MDRTCTRAHNGKFPQDAILSFCIKADCDKKFACGRCYHDYHSDHFPQLKPIDQLPAFINQANEQRLQANTLFDQLQVIQKQLNQTIQGLCQRLKQEINNLDVNITEEMLDSIIKKNHNILPNMDGLEYFAHNFNMIDNALKSKLKIHNFIYVIENKPCEGFTYSGEIVNGSLNGTGKAVYADGRYYYNLQQEYTKGNGSQDQDLAKEQYGFWTGMSMKVSSKMIRQTDEAWTNVLTEIFTKGTIKMIRKMNEAYLNGLTEDIYEGDYKDDKKNDRECQQFSNDGKLFASIMETFIIIWDIIRGRNGRGIFKWADGDMQLFQHYKSYEGDYKDDKANGRGIFKWADGNIYEGDYKDYKRNGQGLMKWAKGDIYEEDYKDDKRNGQGILEWANGDIYQGDWVDNKRTGFGKFISKNGSTEIGQWSNDQKQGDHQYYELKKTAIITYQDHKEIKRKMV